MLLLDTQIVFWLAHTPELLSARAAEALRTERRSGTLAISDKSLWELAVAVSRDRIRIGVDLRDFMHEVESRFHVFPITAAIAERSMRFSARYPKDPADRIIGATALVHSLSLVTADHLIRASGEVLCIW